MDAGGGYILGIDAGQTSTKAILAHAESGTAVYRSGGPVDHFNHYGARRRNEQVVTEVVEALCGLATIRPQEIEAAAIGWTAVRPDSPEALTVQTLISDVLPTARHLVLPDYVVSLAGASVGETGIVVIAGGGSIAYGLAPDGQDAVVGGLGYLLGDEGSAYDIGRRAVSAAARSSDGRGRKTALEDVIRGTFGLQEVRDITRLVYEQGFSRTMLANLAPVVAALAGVGDDVAGQIMMDAGHELGRAAVAVARTLEMTSPAVYTAGGVFSAGEVVQGPFRQTVRDALPHAIVGPASHPPVVGAVLLARRAGGRLDDATWLTRVAGAYTQQFVP